MSKAVSQTETASVEEKLPSISKMRIVGLLLIILAVIIAWFLLVAYAGWQSGERLLTERQEAALATQVAHQIDLAAEDVSQEKYNLALRRLDWVLTREPQNQEALTLKTEAEDSLIILLNPTATPVIVPTPTSMPTPFPTQDPGNAANPAEADLQNIRRLMALKEWQTAVSAILDFQLSYPDYERLETDQHLYDAYIKHGLDLVDGENVELGMYYLAQAEKLGDLSQTVQDYQTWAELYLQGVAFYGANWDASAYYFRDLCLAAPFYQSSCDRLYEVLILFGDQEADALEWCPAADLYNEALLYGNESGLAGKLQEAQEACLLATPTPDIPSETITNTQSITNTLPFVVPTSSPTSTPLP